MAWGWQQLIDFAFAESFVRGSLPPVPTACSWAFYGWTASTNPPAFSPQNDCKHAVLAVGAGPFNFFVLALFRMGSTMSHDSFQPLQTAVLQIQNLALSLHQMPFMQPGLLLVVEVRRTRSLEGSKEAHVALLSNFIFSIKMWSNDWNGNVVQADSSPVTFRRYFSDSFEPPEQADQALSWATVLCSDS